MNTHTMDNGNTLHWIDESMVKVTDQGYMCYQYNRHCFKRGTHEKIIKLLEIDQMDNLTFKEFYSKIR